MPYEDCDECGNEFLALKTEQLCGQCLWEKQAKARLAHLEAIEEAMKTVDTFYLLRAQPAASSTIVGPLLDLIRNGAQDNG